VAGLRAAIELAEAGTVLVAAHYAMGAVRTGSQGAHFRVDYPRKSSGLARHSVVSRHADVMFR
jgi:aspartate oxidase